MSCVRWVHSHWLVRWWDGCSAVYALICYREDILAGDTGERRNKRERCASPPHSPRPNTSLTWLASLWLQLKEGTSPEQAGGGGRRMGRASGPGQSRLKPGLIRQPPSFISLLSACDCGVRMRLPPAPPRRESCMNKMWLSSQLDSASRTFYRARVTVSLSALVTGKGGCP